jgi:hypothetical protein
MTPRVETRGSCLAASVGLSLLLLTSLFAERTASFPTTASHIKQSNPRTGMSAAVSNCEAATTPPLVRTECFQVYLNAFFKRPVPIPLKQSLSLYYEATPAPIDLDVVTLLTSAPSVPGVPRPLWLVMMGILPTGLLWYGYYKFAVEEELLQMELDKGKIPRGFGGYGSLGPFLLGQLALMFQIPGGLYWSSLGLLFIHYTQFLLYDRVNELYVDEGREAPLHPWWCLPICFPFNIIVGLRQVHFLSQYLYEKRGAIPPPNDPIADLFPFIKAPRFSWQEFLFTPSLWCCVLKDIQCVDKNKLPAPFQAFLNLDDKGKLIQWHPYIEP